MHPGWLTRVMQGQDVKEFVNHMQGQAADVQSPTPMLEAHWETVHQHSSILFFKQAVLTVQVLPRITPLVTSPPQGLEIKLALLTQVTWSLSGS